jgi:hypothetical protein
MSFAVSNVIISVSASLDQSVGSLPLATDTTIFFAGNSNCNYPSTMWTTVGAATSCDDTYLLPISWDQAVNMCGFTEIATDVFQQTITVKRHYQLTSSLDRYESVSRVLQVTFPQSVQLSASVTVLGVLSNVNALSSVSFDVPSGLWNIAMELVSAAPYKLDLLSVATPDSRYGVDFSQLSPDFTFNTIPTYVTTGFTMSTWVQFYGPVSRQTFLIYTGNPSFNGYGVFVGAFSGELLLLAGSQFVWDTGYALPVGQNVFVSFVVDNTATAYIYVDGVLQFTQGGFYAATPYGTTSIGTNSFNGILTSVQMWQEARTAEELIGDSVLCSLLNASSPNLVMYFPFNEGTGLSTLEEISGIEFSLLNSASAWATFSQCQAGFNSDMFARYVPGSDTLSDQSGCQNNTQVCTQIQAASFTDCSPLSGTFIFTYGVVCDVSEPDCVPPVGTAIVSTTINTGSSCPVTHTISFSSLSLSSFADSGATDAQAAFNDNSIGYFGADIQSDEAVIVSRTVTSVCLQYHGVGTCVPVNFNDEPSVNGLDPVFSVDMSQTLAISTATGQSWTLSATIAVQFEGAKRQVNSQQVGIQYTFVVTDGTPTIPAPTKSSVAPTSTFSTTSIALVAGLAGLVALLGGITAFVLFRKKCATSTV